MILLYEILAEQISVLSYSREIFRLPILSVWNVLTLKIISVEYYALSVKQIKLNGVFMKKLVVLIVLASILLVSCGFGIFGTNIPVGTFTYGSGMVSRELVLKEGSFEYTTYNQDGSIIAWHKGTFSALEDLGNNTAQAYLDTYESSITTFMVHNPEVPQLKLRYSSPTMFFDLDVNGNGIFEERLTDISTFVEN